MFRTPHFMPEGLPFRKSFLNSVGTKFLSCKSAGKKVIRLEKNIAPHQKK